TAARTGGAAGAARVSASRSPARRRCARRYRSSAKEGRWVRRMRMTYTPLLSYTGRSEAGRRWPPRRGADGAGGGRPAATEPVSRVAAGSAGDGARSGAGAHPLLVAVNDGAADGRLDLGAAGRQLFQNDAVGHEDRQQLGAP